MHRLVVIDGYNFIGATATLGGDRLERERDRLVERLARYVEVRGHEVVVVFDGAAHGPGGRGQPSRGGVRVFFSPPGTKADPWLVELARRSRGQCVVVSDDHGVAGPSRGAGAAVLSCAEWDRFLRAAERERARVALDGDGADGTSEPDFEPPEAWKDGPVGRSRPPVAGRAAGGSRSAVRVPRAPTRAPTRATTEGADAWDAFAAGVTPVSPGPARTADRGPLTAHRDAGDAEAWEAFLAGRYDPTRELAASEDRAPAVPAPGQGRSVRQASDSRPRTADVPDPDFVAALMAVPDGVAAAKDLDEVPRERPESGVGREERHRRNLLKDL